MAEAAVCPKHPAVAALGNCARCGAFYCAADSKLLEGKLYCDACAARPDVDWLEAWKMERWGKRDGWAWLFGIFSPLTLLTAVNAFIEGLPIAGVFSLAAAVAGALWWLGLPVARIVMVLAMLSQAVVSALTLSPLTLLGFVLPLAILFSVMTSVRTRLFFKIDVPRADLKKAWDLYANNNVARYALQLGILGLLFWPIAPLAALCGVIGLARVDLEARPPIGRRGSAIAGIVCGALGTIAGAVFLVINWGHNF